MARIYDITIPMHEKMPAFPGDVKVFQMKELMHVAKGDDYTIKQLTMLTHTGTHIDFPIHIIPDTRTLEQVDLSKFVGTAKVIEIKDPQKVDLDEIKNIDIQPDTIVLFKTKNSELWKQNRQFNENYVYVTPEAAKFLVKKKVKAVGIDYLSIDAYGETFDPVTHVILLGKDIPIIEGLDLSEVPEGLYRFTCLPLKIEGADGSPARAILEELEG